MSFLSTDLGLSSAATPTLVFRTPMLWVVWRAGWLGGGVAAARSVSLSVPLTALSAFKATLALSQLFLPFKSPSQTLIKTKKGEGRVSDSDRYPRNSKNSVVETMVKLMYLRGKVSRLFLCFLFSIASPTPGKGKGYKGRTI